LGTEENDTTVKKKPSYRQVETWEENERRIRKLEWKKIKFWCGLKKKKRIGKTMGFRGDIHGGQN
jgi:hypothetical protein